MKIAYANVRSLNTSFNLVETACVRQQIKILGLSEIWHPNNSVKDTVRQSWHWIATERNGERGGGAALMIAKECKVFERKDLKRDNLEAVWSNIYSVEGNFILGSIYIPPNNSISLRVLFQVLDDLRQQSLPIILIGDFNAHHSYWYGENANKLGTELFEYLSDKDLSIINTEQPTRKDKIIDLTIVSNRLEGKISKWQVQQEVYLNTDHNLISFEFGQKDEEGSWERFDFKKADWSRWETSCEGAIEEWLSERRGSGDVNEDYCSFVDLLRQVADECIPKKNVCKHSKGWWNPQLTVVSKELKKAKRKFAKRCDAANERYVQECLERFKKEESKARDNYLEDMVKMMDPKKPSQFWQVVNKERKTKSKSVVQPILRDDGTLAVTDEEIFVEIKKRYGKETLDVRERNPTWYAEVEQEAELTNETERKNIKVNSYSQNCSHENSDITVDEVEAAIKGLSSFSAPNPEEQIFNLMLKKGGEAVAKGLHYIFQKCWELAVLPEAFITDAKVMLPKPGKSNYNTVRAYRPITLESVVGKLMERVITYRLVWKLEVEGGFASTQNAYRKQKSCVQSVLRIANSLSEARIKKENSVLTIMDYESCYERIWRAGLLYKATRLGLTGRMWLYVRNFLWDRVYYIRVNNYKSNIFKSAVGIPQGSVISPVLCNLYTHDSMVGVEGKHTEYADDVALLISNSSLDAACEATNRELNLRVQPWCNRWNMLVAADKTDVLVVTQDSKEPSGLLDIKLGDEKLNVVKSKKILGVTIDNQLSYHKHIEEKVNSGFRALKGLDNFIKGHKGCSQSVFLKLYNALVLPIMDYAAPVTVSATTECIKEFGKVHRAAMLKASGCLNSTSTDALEVLTNTIPIDLHIKMRQAQEVVRIGAKHSEDPLKKDFLEWTASSCTSIRKPSTFQLLMCRFKEMKGKAEFDKIEQDFTYTKEYLGLVKVGGKVDTEEFKLEKAVQEENVRVLLGSLKPEDVIVFTDGSAYGNPGPTGAGGVVYLEGYNAIPVLLKKGVSPMSNNYTGELVGIQISLEFLTEVSNLENKNIHFFTDCQGAILSAFQNQIPSNKIEIVTSIKQSINQLIEKGNKIHAHWVPGHKDITGNELADQQAKAGAHEMLVSKDPVSMNMDKREANAEIRMQAGEKWKLKFMLSEKMERIQEIFIDVGRRSCYGEMDRAGFSALNQILSGHTMLNDHQSKLNQNVSEMCSDCKVPETVEHYIFDCDKYTEERKELEKTTEDVLGREGINCTVVDVKVLSGNIEVISREARSELTGALLKYIRSTKRFF